MEFSVAVLQTDIEGKLVASELVAQILAGKDVNHLVQTFWQKAPVAIKSLRSGIDALSIANFEKISRTKSHTCLLAVLYYVRAILAEKRHREHLNCAEWTQLWTTVGRVLLAETSTQLLTLALACWSDLLEVRTAIPSHLDELAVDILQFEQNTDREQSYDGSLMACTRLLYEYLTLLGSPTSTEVMEFGIKLWSLRSRPKNSKFCHEAALLIKHLERPLAHEDALAMVENFKPFATITAADVQFGPSRFERRPGAPQLPWIVSESLALLYVYLDQTQLEDAQETQQSKRRRIEYDLEYIAQIACFSSCCTPDFSCTFWWFVWAGQNAHSLSSPELLEQCSLAVQNMSRCSGAAYTLAKSLQVLTGRDEEAGPTLNLVNTWLSSLDRLELRAAPVYLFCVLKTLRIVDVDFQHRLELLDSWLARELMDGLQYGAVSVRVVEQLGDLVPSLVLVGVTPSKQSYFAYLALCAQMDYTPKTGIVTRLLKDDIEDLVIAAKIINKLRGHWDYSEVLNLARESELDSLHLEYALTGSAPTPEHIIYAPTIEQADEFTFKTIVSGVLAKYELNRSAAHLCKIMDMMKTMPQTKAEQEFTGYLLKTVTEQSKLSPLRAALAPILRSGQDWRLLIESSTKVDVLHMLSELKLPKNFDFGALLMCEVPWMAELLYALVAFERLVSVIVAKLLLLDAVHMISPIAAYFKTTSQQLFRDIGSNLIFLWCQERNVQEFPFDAFECDSKVGETYCPVTLLPDEWIDEPALFALYTVRGLKDPQVKQRLEEALTPAQLKNRLKQFDSQIKLKAWSTVALNHPSQLDICLDEVPPAYYPDAPTACWIMEQMVLQVVRFRREEVDLACHQVWNLFNSLPEPVSTAATAVRCFLALSELGETNVVPMFQAMAQKGHLEPILCAEIFAHSPTLYEALGSCELELPESAVGEALRSCLPGQEQEHPIYPPILAQALHELGRSEYPFYLAQRLYLAATPNLDLKTPDLELLAPEVCRWRRVFNNQSASWLSWANRLEATYGPFEAPRSFKDARATQLEKLHRLCQESPYVVRFAVNPFLQKYAPSNRYLEVSFSSMSKRVTPVVLHDCERGPTDGLMTPLAPRELAQQLFEKFTSISLNQAFQLKPELATQIVPFEVAEACCDNKQNLALVQKIFGVQLRQHTSIALSIVAEAYKGGSLIADFEDIVSLCISQGEFALGLMFAELQWSENQQVPSSLPKVVSMSKDEDIKAIVAAEPSLSALKLPQWEQLSFGMMSDNKSIAADSLRAHGVFDLANSLEKRGFFDYESAWKLQQWELPECAHPKTEEATLFNLFRLHRPLPIDEALIAGPNHDLIALESQTRPAPQASANLRLAFEVKFQRSGSIKALVEQLALSHEAFFADENKEQCVAYTRRLEHFAKDEFRSVSRVALAKTAWLLGDQVVSIRTLEQVIQSLPAPLVNSAQVLCMLAMWSDQAKHASEATLIKNYLSPAVEAANASRDVETMAATYHTYAAYCDGKYSEPGLSNDIHQARKMRDEQKSHLEMYRKGSQLNREDKSLYSKTKLAQQHFDSEQKEYVSLKEKLRNYLELSLKFYMKSLALGGGKAQLNDSCRFIALWFSQPEASVNTVKKHIETIPSYVFVPWANQLTSKLGAEAIGFHKLLIQLVVKLGKEHPHHLLWPLASLLLGEDKARSDSAKAVWASIPEGIKAGVHELAAHMVAVAQHKVKSEDRKSFGFSKMRSEVKWWQGIKKHRLVCPAASIPVKVNCNYNSLPTIDAVSMQISIANGLSAPKIVKYTTSDGRSHTMLLKGGNDDLRQDAVMEQVFGHVNSFLSQDREARVRNLCARTYAVVPLGPNAGVIEFVPNTISLYDALDPLHTDCIKDPDWSRSKARQLMHASYEYGRESRISTYQQITRHIKPVMRLFFFQNYKSADEWLAKRTAFSRSVAAMSIVGHILGLGDRHCNNILVDVASGQVVHIDLGIAFDQGKYLRIPETVPFRLTRDIVDGMGVAGVEGPFKICAEITLKILRQEQKQINTVLEVLRYDPLYSWNASALRQKLAQGGAGGSAVTNSSIDAEQALLGVKRKLSGRLNVMAYVRELVDQATSDKNLALIFEGWTPFY